jgi:hypothetical protein
MPIGKFDLPMAISFSHLSAPRNYAAKLWAQVSD